MSIVIRSTDKLLPTSAGLKYPDVTYSDYPPELDHREEIVSIKEQYPTQFNPAAPPSKLDKKEAFKARLAEAVVAFVPTDDLIALQPNITPQNMGGYWQVKTRNQTIGTDIRQFMGNTIGKTLKTMSTTLGSRGYPLSSNQIAEIDARTSLPVNFIMRIKTSLVNQPALGVASGCLIAPDRILTCGHLDEEEEDEPEEGNRFINRPQKYKVLFGYRNGDIKDGDILPAWQVREIDCVEVIPWTSTLDWDDQKKGTGRFDTAILKLKALPSFAVWPEKPPVGMGPPAPKPLPIGTIRPYKAKGLKIAYLGCPYGGPLKWSEADITNAPAQQDMLKNKDPSGDDDNPEFGTTLEAFRGASGSPVFKITGEYESAEIWGVVANGYPFTGYKDPKPAIVDVVRKILTSDQSRLITDKLLRRFVFYNGFLIDEDRKGGTFIKIPAQLIRDAKGKYGCQVCRVDPLNYFLMPLGDPGRIQLSPYHWLEKTSLISIRLANEMVNPKPFQDDGITISFFGIPTQPVKPTIVGSCLIGRFGGVPEDVGNFQHYLNWAAKLVQPSQGYDRQIFIDEKTNLNGYKFLSGAGGPGAANPGLTYFLQPGRVENDTKGTGKYIDGFITVVHRIATNIDGPGLPFIETFVFSGRVISESGDGTNLRVHQWIGPLAKEQHLPLFASPCPWKSELELNQINPALGFAVSLDLPDISPVAVPSTDKPPPPPSKTNQPSPPPSTVRQLPPPPPATTGKLPLPPPPIISSASASSQPPGTTTTTTTTTNTAPGTPYNPNKYSEWDSDELDD